MYSLRIILKLKITEKLQLLHFQINSTNGATKVVKWYAQNINAL